MPPARASRPHCQKDVVEQIGTQVVDCGDMAQWANAGRGTYTRLLAKRLIT